MKTKYSGFHKYVVDPERSSEQFFNLFKGKEGMIVSAFGGEDAYLLVQDRVEKMKAFVEAVREWSGLRPGDSAETWSLDSIPESIVGLLYENENENDSIMNTFLSRGWVIMNYNSVGATCRVTQDLEFFPLVGDSSNISVVYAPPELGDSIYEVTIGWISETENKVKGFLKFTGDDSTGEELEIFPRYDVTNNNTNFLIKLWEDNGKKVWFDNARFADSESLNDPEIVPTDFGFFFPVEVVNSLGETIGYNVLGFNESPDADYTHVQKANDSGDIAGWLDPASGCGYGEFDEYGYFQNHAMTKEEFLEEFPEFAYLFPQSIGLQATKRNKIIAF